MELSRNELLMYSTHRIEMLNNNEDYIGCATGFLMGFPCKESDQYIHLVLVTNRHVLGRCAKIRITFISKASYPYALHRPDTVAAILSTDKAIFHPNPNIDLAILKLNPCIKLLNDAGTPPFYSFLKPDLIPTPDDWENFDAMESVIMIGYPSALYDSVNILPIFRQGLTATHLSFDFQGKPEFLVDMSVFPGSSGSPVLIHNLGVPYFDKKSHTIKMAERTFLIGIQYATRLKSEPISSENSTGVIQQYIDLGCIIKSSELLAFVPLLDSAGQHTR